MWWWADVSQVNRPRVSPDEFNQTEVSHNSRTIHSWNFSCYTQYEWVIRLPRTLIKQSCHFRAFNQIQFPSPTFLKTCTRLKIKVTRNYNGKKGWGRMAWRLSFDSMGVLVENYLLCLLKFPCLVNFWSGLGRQCGGLNEELSTLVSLRVDFNFCMKQRY